MLELRIACEHCATPLPNTSDKAMICSYECTFCNECVEHVLHNVCPNCGGGFEKRPIRPKAGIIKNPPRKDLVVKAVQKNTYLKKNINLDPKER